MPHLRTFCFVKPYDREAWDRATAKVVAPFKDCTPADRGCSRDGWRHQPPAAIRNGSFLSLRDLRALCANNASYLSFVFRSSHFFSKGVW